MAACVRAGCISMDVLSQRPFLSAICLPFEHRSSQIGTTLHRQKPSEFAALSSPQPVSNGVAFPTRTQPWLESLPRGGLAGHPCVLGDVREAEVYRGRTGSPSGNIFYSPLILLPHPAIQPVLGDPWHLHSSLVAPGGSFCSGPCGAHGLQPDGPLRRR